MPPSLIRPDLKARLWLWREPILGGVLTLCGAAWVFTEFGLMFWVGLAVTCAGAIVVYTGVQRLRFQVGAGGPGVVQVTERQVTYFGPEEGGAVSIDALAQITLVPGKSHNAWVLRERTGLSLAIPTHASGADALFDVFASLDGIRTEHMLSQLRTPPKMPTVIWSLDQSAKLPSRHLH
ncbi:MAG: hypothetical protein AAF748_11110 [Pseudomonadota bacterium]